MSQSQLIQIMFEFEVVAGVESNACFNSKVEHGTNWAYNSSSDWWRYQDSNMTLTRLHCTFGTRALFTATPRASLSRSYWLLAHPILKEQLGLRCANTLLTSTMLPWVASPNRIAWWYSKIRHDLAIFRSFPIWGLSTSPSRIIPYTVHEFKIWNFELIYFFQMFVSPCFLHKWIPGYFNEAHLDFLKVEIFDIMDDSAVRSCILGQSISKFQVWNHQFLNKNGYFVWYYEWNIDYGQYHFTPLSHWKPRCEPAPFDPIYNLTASRHLIIPFKPSVRAFVYIDKYQWNCITDPTG